VAAVRAGVASRRIRSPSYSVDMPLLYTCPEYHPQSGLDSCHKDCPSSASRSGLDTHTYLWGQVTPPWWDLRRCPLTGTVRLLPSSVDR
jgi:hypothetical protein